MAGRSRQRAAKPPFYKNVLVRYPVNPFLPLARSKVEYLRGLEPCVVMGRGASQVMHVPGLNMRPGASFGRYSYGFAGVGHVWGWAPSRRAWRLFDASLADFPAMRHDFGRGAPPLRRALGRKFASARAGRKFTWARAWYYTTVRHGGVAIIPGVNLGSRLGHRVPILSSSPQHPHERAGRSFF